MKAMEPGAPMISVPAGVLKEFMTSSPSPTAASLVNNTPTDSPKAPSLTRTPSPDLPTRGDDSALPTDNTNNKKQMNGDSQSNDSSVVEKITQNNSDTVTTNLVGPNINLPSSITVTNGNVSPVGDPPEKRQLNGTVLVGSSSSISLKRPSEEAEGGGSKYPDLKKIRVFAEDKSKSVESTVQEFNKLLDQESKKFEDPEQDDIMCISNSVTVTKSDDRTVNDSTNSESVKTVPPPSEPAHPSVNSPLPKYESNTPKNDNSAPKYENNTPKFDRSSLLEFEDKPIDILPKSEVKITAVSISDREIRESLALLSSDLEVLTPPPRESDAVKQDTKFSGKQESKFSGKQESKFIGKLKKISRKELEKVVMRLFSEKTLYHCELGKQKQLCEKLETTLESNRKKTAQFHKEIEDLRKVTNRLAAEQASRKGQYVAPIRIKRSVGIQAAPHIINKGLQHAQGQNSSIKTISPRSSLSPMKNNMLGTGNPARLQNASPNVTFHTKMIPSNTPNMLAGGGVLSPSQPGGRPQALSTGIIQGSPTLVSTPGTGTLGTVSHPVGSIGTVRPPPGQMMLMTQTTQGMMQTIPRPPTSGVLYTANRTVVPVMQGKVVRSSVVPISNIISSGNVLSNQRHMIVHNKDVTATTNAINTPLISRSVGSSIVDLTADEGRTTVGRTTSVMPAPGTLVKVPVTGTTQLVAIPAITQSGGVVLLPNASGAALVSGVQTVNNVTNPIVAQSRTGTVTSTPRVMGASFRPISATTTTGSSSQHRHPAPLPRTPVQQISGMTKKLPPQPTLKLSHKDNSIVLSWTMGKTEDHEAIASYQLYAYQEGTLPPNPALWKKVGSVKALELPMACTLTQFMPGHVYHFAVRAVDIKSRLGPFSDPRSIRLEKK